MEYLLHIFVLACIYAILAVSLDLVAGQAGLLSLAHGAFYALGAYSSALLAVHLGVPFLLGIVVGMGVAAAVSFIVSLSSLRLHGDYFVIATFAFQMILLSVINNWMELTRGPLGIPGVPRPQFFGWRIQSTLDYAILAGGCAATSYWVVGRIATSPFGRVLRAIREDEVFAQSTGKNTFRVKAITFAVSAALAAIAGSIYAHYITYIDPTSFTVMESILVLSMVILGGAGSLWGPLVGALALVILPEALQAVGLPAAIAAQLRQVFYGSLLVAMMVLRPRGLVGRYGFGR